MNKKDIQNIQMLYENVGELYDGEWEANIEEGNLPEGKHVAFQHGYNLTIGENTAKIDNGIRGRMNLNARVVGNKVYLSYIKR
jgi:hypothetical protein